VEGTHLVLVGAQLAAVFLSTIQLPSSMINTGVYRALV
jgi:hypothetical protein